MEIVWVQRGVNWATDIGSKPLPGEIEDITGLMGRFLLTDPMVSGPNPLSAKLSFKVRKIRQLSMVPDVRIMSRGPIDRKDVEAAR